MDKKRLLEKLVSHLDNLDELPNGLTIEKIVDRAYDICEEDDLISFKMERHPGPLGSRSRGPGVGLSAFFREVILYSHHIKKNTLDAILLESEFEYDPYLMAMEMIDSLEEGGFFSDTHKETKDENEVIGRTVDLTVKYYEEMREIAEVPETKYNKMIEDVVNEIKKRLI